ncbi:hypothetical protein BJ508DRAFT_332253 [Ascobolus immersus RN42]|uniref:Uncharacterized protein n=1 Tax=Ascobolus immersus RN42 TaxID=1160509 RepID=A0A3N4HU07_ASCIM|nr:hypothetical protein BJ508DRAFT_332253 [Ascobolus immersus RN42]
MEGDTQYLSPSSRTYQCPMDGDRIASEVLQPFRHENGNHFSFFPGDLVDWNGDEKELKHNHKIDLESLDLDEFERYLEDAFGGIEGGRTQLSEPRYTNEAYDPIDVFNRISSRSATIERLELAHSNSAQKLNDLMAQIHAQQAADTSQIQQLNTKPLFAIHQSQMEQHQDMTSKIRQVAEKMTQDPGIQKLAAIAFMEKQQGVYSQRSQDEVDYLTQVTEERIMEVTNEQEQIQWQDTQQQSSSPPLNTKHSLDNWNQEQAQTQPAIEMPQFAQSQAPDQAQAQLQSRAQALDQAQAQVQSQSQAQVQEQQVHVQKPTLQMWPHLRAFGQQLADRGVAIDDIRKMMSAIALHARAKSQAQLRGQLQIPPNLFRAITTRSNGQPVPPEQQVMILERFWQETILQQLQGKTPLQIMQMVLNGQQQSFQGTRPAMVQMQPPSQSANISTPSQTNSSLNQPQIQPIQTSLGQHSRNLSLFQERQQELRAASMTPTPQPQLMRRTPSRQQQQPSPYQQYNSNPYQPIHPSPLQQHQASPLQHQSYPQQQQRSPYQQEQPSPYQPAQPSPLQQHQTSPFQHQAHSPQQQPNASPMLRTPSSKGTGMRRTPSMRPPPTLVVLSSDEGDNLLKDSGGDERQKEAQNTNTGDDFGPGGCGGDEGYC